jgi:hypothetical protein
MGLGTTQMTGTTGDNFKPEIWIDEVRAFMRANLVLADKIKMISFEGRAGDTLHIPDITELTTTAKAANAQVTLQAPTEGKFDLSINFHQETSFLIEDILAVQSAYDLRTEYTKAAGYAIAKQLDRGLGGLVGSLTTKKIGSDGSTNWLGANGSDLTEAGIRAALEVLDTANVPNEDRFLWIHPAQKNVLLSIARFTEYQMIGMGGMPLRTGQFGEIFGVPVYVSTNPLATGTAHGCILGQKNAFACAIQHSPRVQAQYKLEYLGNLFVVDAIYGYGVFRDNHAVGLFTAA